MPAGPSRSPGNRMNASGRPPRSMGGRWRAALLICGLAGGCTSAPPAAAPAQAAVPEVTLLDYADGLVEGPECEVSGALRNTGPVPIAGASAWLRWRERGRVVPIGERPLEPMPPGGVSRFRFRFRCAAADGPLLVDVELGDVQIRMRQPS